MIIWLRGPSGSGKSTTAHRFLDEFGPGTEVYWPANVPLPGKDKARKKPRLIGYELSGGMFLLGPYHVAGGGLDNLGGSVLRTQIPIVERAAQKYPFVFTESLTAGNVTPGHFIELEKRLGSPVIMPVLATPLDDCIASIYQRQVERGTKIRKVNEEVIKTIGERIHLYQERAVAEGLNAPFVDREVAYGRIISTFKQHGWSPDG